jgi:alpha-galactosidase
MAVEGALTGDPRLVFQAICYDPLTSAVLSLAEIRQMVNQMFEQNKEYLAYFKSLSV